MVKKIAVFAFIFMAIIMGMSCSQTNSPTAAAKAWVRAFEKGDAAALGKVSTPESAARTSGYMSNMQAQFASNPVKDYSEKISDDRNSAIVTVTFKDNTNDTIKLVKINGKWLVSE
jgi:O-acetyl-ADP-ribose deacetylase (regulator of RNase III)